MATRHRAGSQWSAWSWTEEYNCEYRYRQASDGTTKYEYRNAPNVDPSASTERGRTPQYDPTYPPIRKVPSIGPRPRSRSPPRPPPPPPPPPPPRTDYLAEQLASTYLSNPQYANAQPRTDAPRSSDSQSQSYSQSGDKDYKSSSGTIEPQKLQVSVNQQKAIASFGMGEHSFISNHFAKALRLSFEELPTKKTQYFVEGTKSFNCTRRVKLKEVACGKRRVKDLSLYVIPKEACFQEDIEVGKKLQAKLIALPEEKQLYNSGEKIPATSRAVSNPAAYGNSPPSQDSYDRTPAYPTSLSYASVQPSTSNPTAYGQYKVAQPYQQNYANPEAYDASPQVERGVSMYSGSATSNEGRDSAYGSARSVPGDGYGNYPSLDSGYGSPHTASDTGKYYPHQTGSSRESPSSSALPRTTMDQGFGQDDT